MEKRVLIAIVLSIAVMYGYSFIFPPQKPTVSNKPLAPAASEASKKVDAARASSPAVAPDIRQVQTLNAKEVIVETDVLRAVFSTQGATLKELILKKYRDKAGSGSNEVVLFRESSPANYILGTEAPVIGSANTLLFSADTDAIIVSDNSTKSIEFTAVTSGVVLKKKFTFTSSGYGISLDTTLINSSSAPLEGTVQNVLRNSSRKPGDDPGRYEVFGPVTLSDSGVSFDSLADLAKGERSFQKGVKWTGFGDKYFLRAIIANKSSASSVSIKDTAGYCEQRVFSDKFSISPLQQTSFSTTVFFGPKDIDILKAQGSQLEESIDLGWFSALAKPLLHTIKLFYKYLGNYGLAIILITVILKIIFFPLTHKSYKSMKEMQKLQPKMQELKDIHKDDRDALNRSVMELYKTHKVNPLGGCLPMIIQIPVFFGLYKALMFSIELRHAPFYFWLHDLSAKDPYYVTPIIMGVTMFIQQKMTPTNMDPVQAKMMLALPVVFTAMFLNFPSGLVLYWLVNNVLTIAQQAYINSSLKEA